MTVDRPMRLIILASLVGVMFAGCFADSGSDLVEEPDWAVDAIFAGVDPADVDHIVEHDHTDAALHSGLSTPNFEVVGHTPLTSDYHGTTAGYHYCGDVTDLNDRRLAVVHSHTTDVAITIMDVTDPAQPMYLGELVLPFVFSYDTSVFDDGSFAVIAGNLDTSYDEGKGPGLAGTGPVSAIWTEEGAWIAPIFRDACGNEYRGSTVDPIPYGYSTILVDLADPANPVVADARQAPVRNMHSVSTYMDDTGQYVASSGLGRTTCNRISLPDGTRVPPSCPPEQVPSAGHATGFYTFYTVEDTPAGARLMDYAVYSSVNTGHPDTLVDTAVLSNGHMDATIDRHDETGTLMAYLADWDGGFIIIEIASPGLGVHQDTWGAWDPDMGHDMTGNVHHAVPVEERIDGRIVVLTGQEIGGPAETRPTGQIAALDVTDPTNIEPIMRWTLPVEMLWDAPYAFSPHYPIYVDGTLFTSMYHGGVWAADASPHHWPDLPSSGVFLPDAEAVGAEAPFRATLAPEVLEVLDLGDGHLLVYDANSGAYVVRWTGSHDDVPLAAPWPDNPWMG